MNRIRFFFLQILFLLTPVVYAWLYAPGIQGNLSDVIRYLFPHLAWAWFESVKVTFFLFCISIIAIIHFTYILLQKKYISVSHSFFLVLWVFFLWSFFSFWINRDINPYFFSGNLEKHHGWFVYFWLIILFFIVQELSSLEQKRLLKMSLWWAVGVALYAIFQKNGLDPLADSYQTRLDMNRAFSTLGNPNYLAWLFLMVLPLAHERVNFRNSEHTLLAKLLLWLVWGFLIYWTGSYLAWIMFPLAMLFFLAKYVFPTKKSQYIFWLFVVLVLFLSFVYTWNSHGSDILEMQKMKWFIARWFLWKTWFYALTSDIRHFFFWYGPDGFLAVSEYFRHPLLSVYEDPAYRIDRSHNVFIDFALHFGSLMLFVVVLWILQKFRHLSHGKKISLILFALYFSFNIPVLVHFMILLQIIAFKEKTQFSHQ